LSFFVKLDNTACEHSYIANKVVYFYSQKNFPTGKKCREKNPV